MVPRFSLLCVGVEIVVFLSTRLEGIRRKNEFTRKIEALREQALNNLTAAVEERMLNDLRTAIMGKKVS